MKNNVVVPLEYSIYKNNSFKKVNTCPICIKQKQKQDVEINKDNIEKDRIEKFIEPTSKISQYI